MMNEDTTCMDASLKRKLSSDVLPSHSDSESDHESDFHSHSKIDLPILDTLVGDYGFEVLAQKLENNPQLNQMATEIFQSVKLAVENGEQVTTIPTQVKTMLKCPMFVEAFVEAYEEDACLLPNIQIFKNDAEDQERLENLKSDAALKHILRNTETMHNIMGVLKIAMGYWSDQSLQSELTEAIKEYKKKKYGELAKPKGKIEGKVDELIDLDVPPNIEGLKAAFDTKYDGDVYKRMCDEIDSRKSLYDKIFRCRSPDNNIKRMTIQWCGEDFFVSIIGYD